MLLLLRMSSGEAWNTAMNPNLAPTPTPTPNPNPDPTPTPTPNQAWNTVMHDTAIQPAATRAAGAHVLYGGWEGKVTLTPTLTLTLTLTLIPTLTLTLTLPKAECNDDPETCGLSCCGSEGLAVAYFLSFQARVRVRVRGASYQGWG